eukprot:TRINITY_DN4400_c0_g1_i1.p1 TRINITY_DN4400_c0_g1~~TRINITY_DN4400_c0_g1_i1.p1  ORF type:complete len:140 (-),score=27.69 TRINITY_DN4400_c0_g1_i1:114-533(-)
MSSGIPTTDEAIAAIQRIMRRGGPAWGWFEIKDDTVQCTHESKDAPDFDGPTKHFICGDKGESAGWCIALYEYKTADGRPTDKLVMISWSPDNAPARSKMKHASTHNSFKTYVDNAKIIQCNDSGDLTAERVYEICEKK